jgi:DNA-binding PadR family transcriptional regulator
MRKPVTDITLLAYIAKKNVDVVSYTEATKAVKSSSSASRALHQLIEEGLIEPKPKLIGLRYVTEYAITPKGKQVSQLALQLTQLRESAARMKIQDAEGMFEPAEAIESKQQRQQQEEEEQPSREQTLIKRSLTQRKSLAPKKSKNTKKVN